MGGLGFPCGVAPGVDFSHPASAGLQFSGIPSRNGYVNLLTEQAGTLSGAPTAFTQGIVGPMAASANFSLAGSTFAYPTTTWNSQTLALIFVADSVSLAAARVLLITSNSGLTGFAIRCSSAGVITPTFGGTDIVLASPFGSAFVVGVPYFLAVSVKASAAYSAVLARLDTGATISVNAPTAVTAGAAGTLLQVNGSSSANSALFGKVGPSMHNASFMSLPQLLQWAADPWAFWYPNK